MRCHGWITHVMLLIALTTLSPGCRMGKSDFKANGVISGTPAEAVGEAEILPVAWTSPEIENGSDPTDDDAEFLPALFVQQLEQLPFPSDESQADEEVQLDESPEEIGGIPIVTLQDVVSSVQQTYPMLVSAMLERDIAAGEQLRAWSAFDLNLQAYGIAAPEGFYQTYRHRVTLEQPTFKGGYVLGSYRVGRGNFPAWYGHRETDEGGEFAIGYGVPLLKNRAIDARREALFRANLARQAVEPEVRAQLLEFMRVASHVYWSWVAAGQTVIVQQDLLELAQARVEQIEARVEAEDLAPIASINNRQLIAERETRLIEAERSLQQAAINLSMFFRNEEGIPIIPDDANLPPEFPQHITPNVELLDEDISRALRVRPEFIELQLIAEQVRVALTQAQNALLPRVDAQLLASKDVGTPTPTGDKTPFELEVGLYGELPIQRRDARGKILTSQARLSQIAAERQYLVNTVTAEVQDSVSALVAAAGRIERAEDNLRLASEFLELTRAQFELGDIDLVQLNLIEQAVADARLILISSQAEFFVALASYQTALALDPTAAQD